MKSLFYLMQGSSLTLSSCNGEDVLVSFGGYNGRYSNEVGWNTFYHFPQLCSICLSQLGFLYYSKVNVLKPSHKSTLQSKMVETPVPDSVSAVHNATNATRDMESELETGQEGKIREIVMDNDSQPMVFLMLKYLISCLLLPIKWSLY